MTNAEAKRLIEKWMNIIASEGLYFAEEYKQAFMKAISALSQPQGDLISREDALLCLTGEWLENYKYDELIAKFIRRIKALPSAQPDIEAIRQEIKQAADKQFQIAMGVTDLNERYAHIQMENAYRHSLGIIDKHTETMSSATSEERQGIDDYIDSIADSMKDEPLNFRVGRENVEPEDVPDTNVGELKTI